MHFSLVFIAVTWQDTNPTLLEWPLPLCRQLSAAPGFAEGYLTKISSFQCFSFLSASHYNAALLLRVWGASNCSHRGTPQSAECPSLPGESDTWNIKGCTPGHWDGALVTQPRGQGGKPPNKLLCNALCKWCVNSNSILCFFSPVSIADVLSMFLTCYFQGVIKFKCCLFLSYKKGMLEPAD